MSIRPGFKTISLKQHAVHAQQRSYLIHAESFLSTSSKLSGSASRVQMECFQSGFKKRDIRSTLYIILLFSELKNLGP